MKMRSRKSTKEKLYFKLIELEDEEFNNLEEVSSAIRKMNKYLLEVAPEICKKREQPMRLFEFPQRRTNFLMIDKMLNWKKRATR